MKTIKIPLKVGITGGIGAGKSIVSRVFQLLGIPKYDADSRAKWLMNNDTSLKANITELFGAQAYEDNQLNRKYLAAQAFENKSTLDELNKLVHPAVANDFEQWYSIQDHSPYILKEAALLFETGSNASLDKVIAVTAPEDLRIERVIKRDQRTEQQVKSIIQNQMDEKQKTELSDFVVINDDQHLITSQVLAIHKTLLEEIGR